MLVIGQQDAVARTSWFGRAPGSTDDGSYNQRTPAGARRATLAGHNGGPHSDGLIQLTVTYVCH